MTVTEILIA